MSIQRTNRVSKFNCERRWTVRNLSSGNVQDRNDNVKTKKQGRFDRFDSSLFVQDGKKWLKDIMDIINFLPGVTYLNLKTAKYVD